MDMKSVVYVLWGIVLARGTLYKVSKMWEITCSCVPLAFFWTR